MSVKTLFPFGLSLCLAIIVFCTLGDYGVTCDEPVYFAAGSRYTAWLLSPSLQTLHDCWEFNREHPPLVKVLGGLSHHLFHEKLQWLGSIEAYRLPTVAFVFFLTWALYVFTCECYGGIAATVAVLACFCLPRIFVHTHLMALDYPVTALWFLVIYAFVKGIDDQKWAVCAAMLLGLALLTKLVAVFIYGALLFYCALCVEKPTRIKLARLLPLLIIPPMMFVAFWPWLWTNTSLRLYDYFLFHGHHYANPSYYFGAVRNFPAWHYPLVMTAITTPVITLIPFVVGAFNVERLRHDRIHRLVLFNAALPIVVFSLVKTKEDAIRLFMPAFPFICILAGVGVRQILHYLRTSRLRTTGLAVYAALFGLTAYGSLARDYPYMSATYYNEIIGGVDGAVSRGFEPYDWSCAYRGVLPWMNAHADARYWVYLNAADFKVYRHAGVLREEIKFGYEHDSDFLILDNRRGRFNAKMWAYYKYKEPVFTVKASRTALVSIYRVDPGFPESADPGAGQRKR